MFKRLKTKLFRRDNRIDQGSRVKHSQDRVEHSRVENPCHSSNPYRDQLPFEYALPNAGKDTSIVFLDLERMPVPAIIGRKKIDKALRVSLPDNGKIQPVKVIMVPFMPPDSWLNLLKSIAAAASSWKL